jgi:hypothetical protein
MAICPISTPRLNAISEVATRRSEFTAILKNEGIDGLITALNRKAAGQGGLHSVGDARALSYQAFALPIRPLGVLFGNRWYAHHVAMAPFSP